MLLVLPKIMVNHDYLSLFLEAEQVSIRDNSSSVMGGVCKVWKIIHRNMLIYDY